MSPIEGFLVGLLIGGLVGALSLVLCSAARDEQ